MQNAFLVATLRVSSLSLGAFRAHGTASTGGEAKLDLDDLLVARPGWRPTVTSLPLRAAGLFVFPVNREIGEGIAVLFSCPALDNPWRWAPPALLDTPSGWQPALRQSRPPDESATHSTRYGQSNPQGNTPWEKTCSAVVRGSEETLMLLRPRPLHPCCHAWQAAT
jgi:hypothetical protein